MGKFKMFGLCILFPSLISISWTLDMITPTDQSIRDGNGTLVSTNGTFEAGFFGLESSNNRYFGIWYKIISPKTVVWIANRETPLKDNSGVLELDSDQGILVIKDASGAKIWSSDSPKPPKKQVVVFLSESGNMVMKDASEGVLWQSFDSPGDTLLPGMRLGRNFKTGHFRTLRSWKSLQDPTAGKFSFGVNTNGLPQLVITKEESSNSDDNINNNNKAYRPGSWNGLSVTGLPEEINDQFAKSVFVMNGDEVFYEIQLLNNSTILRSRLTPEGYQVRLIWSNQTSKWDTLFPGSFDQCETYALCGANSICNFSGTTQPCGCLRGFKADSADSTCSRTIPLECNKGDEFLRYEGMKLPDTSSSWYDKTIGLEECERLCLSNCSCTAYSQLNISGNGSGCVHWFNEIVDIRTLSKGGQDFFLKMTMLTPSKIDHGLSKKKLAGILAVCAILIISIALLGLILCIRRKKYNQSETNFWKDKNKKDNIDLPIYDFITISNATDHFSESNKLGQGGFGPVYKGILPDGQEIAVKRLSRTSRQGLHEFKNEVMLIAKLQHRNLVKLLGCSIHQEEKLLIYEFMPNRSLDYFIFGWSFTVIFPFYYFNYQIMTMLTWLEVNFLSDSTRRKLLGWVKRLEIIGGIARGLLYLHQDSRLKIIHRDLKTSNVLLDNDMNSKISDFGMARTFGLDEDEANTNRVMGTYGYMPPEYAVHGSFSVKSDVFGFGVIILEIISGRKNRGFSDPHHHLNLLGHAWRLWIEKRPTELMDDLVDDHSVGPSEILRYIHIGLLCVQERPEDRPNMSSVVLMLNGEKLLSEPSPPGFYTGQAHPTMTNSSSRNRDAYSVNEISNSLLEAR